MVAIYIRQSIAKIDSISDETQLQACKDKLKEYRNNMSADDKYYDEEYKVYKDLGFTGANTNRPNFQNMIKDIKSGKISMVVAYKLDRLSRSMSDYARTIELFKKYDVRLIIAADAFGDSENSKFMWNIMMSFAEFERETTQLRVKDSYYERARHGLFLGGVAPIGFVKIPVRIDGIHSHMLEADSETVGYIRYIFDEYIKPDISLGMIVKEVNKDPSAFGLKKTINSNNLSRTLRNPVYVKADVDVCRYLESKGAKLDGTDISEFDGTKGCTIYGERRNKTRSKFSDMTNCYIQLNRHKGVISAEQWLKVQYKMDNNCQLKNSGKGQNSWLSGIIRCGYCNMAITVVNGQRNGKRYMNCGGRKQKKCERPDFKFSFDELEAEVWNELKGYLEKYSFIRIAYRQENEKEVSRLKIGIEKIKDEIQEIVNCFISANENMKKQLNKKLDDAERKKIQLQKKITELCTSNQEDVSDSDIRRYLESWDNMSIEEKKQIAKTFIDKVIIGKDIEIRYYTDFSDEIQ